MVTAVEETKTAPSVESGELNSDTTGTVETINSPIVEENTESRAMKEEVVEKPIEKVEEKVQPTHNVVSDKERQLQADRDRAEAQLKNVYKQIMPYAEIDPMTGNIVGLKNQIQEAQKQVAPGSQLDELMDAALLTGDKNAMKQVLNIFKEEGTPNYEDPLFIEAAKILEARPELANPLKVRMAVEMAEGRILKRSLPGMQQQIKNEAQTKLKDITASAGITGKSIAKDEGIENLSSAQVSALRREGYDEAGIARIAKIAKQAAKEGGYTL
jgi:hypothetical protein